MYEIFNYDNLTVHFEGYPTMEDSHAINVLITIYDNSNFNVFRNEYVMGRKFTYGLLSAFARENIKIKNKKSLIQINCFEQNTQKLEISIVDKQSKFFDKILHREQLYNNTYFGNKFYFKLLSYYFIKICRTT